MDLQSLAKNIEYIFDSSIRSNKQSFILEILKNLCKVVRADYAILATPLDLKNKAEPLYTTEFITTAKSTLDNIYINSKTGPIRFLLDNGEYYSNLANCQDLYPKSNLIKRFEVKAFIGGVINSKLNTQNTLTLLLFNKTLSKKEEAYIKCILTIFNSRIVSEYAAYNTEKNLKAKVNQMQTQLSTFRDKLLKQEKYASLGRIIFGVAHEFETPINFLTRTNLLLNELNNNLEEFIYKQQGKSNKNDEEIYELRSILHEYSHANAIVDKHANRLKNLSNHISEQFSGQRFIEIDLAKTFEELLHFSIYSSGIKKIVPNFCIKRDIQLSQRFYTVTSDINTVLISLLDNSLKSLMKKYRDSNKEALIKISCHETEDELRFIIYDNGDGVITEHITRDYTPLNEVESSLLITKEIIQKNNGNFEIDSKMGDFEHIIFELPQNDSFRPII